MTSNSASPSTLTTDLQTPSPLQNISNLAITTNNTARNSPPPTKICVFCGASPGKNPAHMAAATSLAKTLAANNIQLIFGGGSSGIMGQVARTLVSLSGPESVHGIIPRELLKYERGLDSEEVSAYDGDHDILPEYKVYGKTTVVKDMHTRKQMMAKEVVEAGEGSGFIALSGGYGTLEELMEVTTWNQLGIHSRGVVVLNIDGYWDGLLNWVKSSVEAGFIGEGNKAIMGEATTAEGAVQALRDYKVAEGRFKLEWGVE